MLKNYFIIAYRNLLRNKTFSLINIFGLALGMALSILMFMYVYYELSYDSFHENKQEIYRVVLKMESKEGEPEIAAITNAGVGPSMLKEFAEVNNMTRFSDPVSGYLKSKDKSYKLDKVTYADSSIFRVFSFPLINGNSETALIEPYTAVITKKTARKIFGNSNPIGEIIRYNNNDDYLVTGVVEDPPANSHLQFDVLLSFTTLYEMPDMFLGWDGGYNYYTYVLLNKNSSVENLKARFPEFMEEQINREYRDVGWFVTLIIEPLKDVHLHSIAEYDLPNKGDLGRIYIFASIALFILLIACINFINLSTARAMKRAREVGLRKVVGASRGQLIRQFIGESVLISLVSLLFALLFIEIIQGKFNQLISADFEFFGQSGIHLVISLILVTLFVGFVAGSFPAFYISGFQPVAILKGYFSTKKGKPVLRNILVTFQFFISVVLIISTIVIIYQLNFLNNKGLGFDKNDIVLVELNSKTAMQKVGVLKNEFRNVPGVSGVAASTSFPGVGLTMNGYFPEGSEHSIMIHVMDVDFDYLDLLKLDVVEGRNFSLDFGTDSTAYLINETLAKQLNWENPVGKYIRRSGKHKVIGVVKDFYFSSLHDKIGPLLITLKPWDYYYYLSLKINPENKKATLQDIEDSWNKTVSDEAINYYFLDARIQKNYQGERQTAQAFIWLAVISIIIACLGLYGQAAYSAEQRTKEIGIRKIMGATSQNILSILSGNFAKIIVIANLIAWPVAWYFMGKWLKEFAFHIDIAWWIFAIALGLSLVITAVTIFTQAIKASRGNPVDALKYE
jgi:putative ABC transport system permease protein